MFLEGRGPREWGFAGACPPLEVRDFSALRLKIARPCERLASLEIRGSLGAKS
jgi:hypothetical protein